jgi:hypothetical protein
MKNKARAKKKGKKKEGKENSVFRGSLRETTTNL